MPAVLSAGDASTEPHLFVSVSPQDSCQWTADLSRLQTDEAEDRGTDDLCPYRCVQRQDYSCCL